MAGLRCALHTPWSPSDPPNPIRPTPADISGLLVLKLSLLGLEAHRGS